MDATSRPVEYLSTGVYAASTFSSSISTFDEILFTLFYEMKAEGSDEDCTYTLQNNFILRSACRARGTYPVEVELRGC